MNGYYKAELVRGPARSGPWKRVEDLELATLGWVHWHNTQRLHGYLDDVPPVEFENTFYAVQHGHNLPVGIKLGKASIKPSADHSWPGCCAEVTSTSHPTSAGLSTFGRSLRNAPRGPVVGAEVS